MPAKRMRGLRAFIAMSEQPVFASTNNARTQLLPPSTVRNTPRSSWGPYAWPSAHASATSGLLGLTTIRPMRPVWSSPTCVQVRPASVDRYTPLPREMLLRMNDSPVPTQITFASDGATANDPIDDTG